MNTKLTKIIISLVCITLILVVFALLPLFIYSCRRLPQEMILAENSNTVSLFLFSGNYFFSPMFKDGTVIYKLTDDISNIYIELNGKKEKINYPYEFSIKYPFQKVTFEIVPNDYAINSTNLFYSLYRKL